MGIYSGELVSMESSQQREDDTYLFNLSNTVVKESKEEGVETSAVEQLTDEQQKEKPDESSLQCQELGLDYDPGTKRGAARVYRRNTTTTRATTAATTTQQLFHLRR